MNETKKKQVGFRRGVRRLEPSGIHEGYAETPDHHALHYTLYGTRGPLLVLSDGVGCDGYIWKYFIPDFARDCRVLHWQYRGHGQSAPPADYHSLSIVQSAHDLQSVIHAVAQEPAILIGHSMGTQVILEYHRLFPTEVAALIPICGAAGHTLDTFMNSNFMKRIFPSLLQFFRTTPHLASWVWNHLIAQPHGYYPAVALQLTSTLCAKDDLQPYLEHLARIDARVFMELAHDMGQHDAGDHLSQVHCPTLVFVADRDNFTPVEKGRAMAEQIPGAELCMMRGATHTAPLELPELISLRLRKFLRQQGFIT